MISIENGQGVPAGRVCYRFHEQLLSVKVVIHEGIAKKFLRFTWLQFSRNFFNFCYVFFSRSAFLFTNYDSGSEETLCHHKSSFSLNFDMKRKK